MGTLVGYFNKAVFAVYTPIPTEDGIYAALGPSKTGSDPAPDSWTQLLIPDPAHR